ncbi:hypothetical protein EJ08DRAFT_52815 [Tothia fuscella]|uniref:Uncharacterized protein n=1 Tax=Tothia fuscella TaxID=1048955 RepID=A0A9P4NFG7_9PEZI|nr:hypothetical protein EJ08DRAFT_52815 [Tothia fuscella]
MDSPALPPIKPAFDSSSASKNTPTPYPFRQRQPRRNPNERLSLNFPARLQLAFWGSAFSGAVLGLSEGGLKAGFKFRAENAHRLPSSEKGWYFYHKSKNYHTLIGGGKEAGRMGLKLGIWVSMFVVMEDAVDQWRGAGKRKDFLSTTVAGLGTSGLFSLWSRFPVTTAARTARTGLWIGLGYGLMQDCFSLLQGRRLGYVEFVKSLLPGKENERIV